MSAVWSLLALPLSLSVAHFAVFALAGAARRTAPTRVAERFPPVAVVIPAWKEGPVVLDNVDALLRQRFDAPIHIVVVADHCAPALVGELRARGVCVHDVAFDTSTKTRAVRLAVANLPADIGAVVILDADNVAHPDFVARVMDRWRGPGTAVQGRRLEKNRTSSLARLEGWMERVNHVVYRQGRARVGLSAALVGSAMMFERRALVAALAEVESVGGFDKGLEMALICRGVRIDWAPDAVVFDEKVDGADAFVAQKRRWISAQTVHFRRWAGRAARASWRTGSLDPLDKLLQWASPPRSLLLAALPLLGAAAALTGSAWSLVFAASWLVLVAAVGVATWEAGTPGELLRALPQVGRIPLAMFTAALRSRGADRTFIHTPHGRRVDADVLAARLRREEG